jgi:hypothetical protein
MKVLVACEFSGVVRDAFSGLNHNAWSCDLEDCERSPEFHLKCNITEILDDNWDLLIAHPPCTYLCSSGARWNYNQTDTTLWGIPSRQKLQEYAIKFVETLLNCQIPRIAIENPIGVLSTRIRKPDQIIQPWMFGHGETKATCLWLKNLPCLVSTEIVEGRENKIHRMGPSKNRSKERSRTYEGIARAMANQWGVLTDEKFGGIDIDFWSSLIAQEPPLT